MAEEAKDMLQEKGDISQKGLPQERIIELLFELNKKFDTLLKTCCNCSTILIHSTQNRCCAGCNELMCSFCMEFGECVGCEEFLCDSCREKKNYTKCENCKGSYCRRCADDDPNFYFCTNRCTHV